ncbi:MAG TPA: PIN domain nuclease [Candidatus Acidoferrum sp.]|nr:PIN domain nuclease [Candidatus Acidoferrum sp.]
MVIVDSAVWIEFLGGVSNPHTQWLERAIPLRRVGLTDLILCEVLQGLRSDDLFNEVRRELTAFRVFSTSGEDLAVSAAQNYRALRALGYTVRKTIDCLIATFCLKGGHALLHRDRDFDPFEKYLGLAVVHPEEP